MSNSLVHLFRQGPVVKALLRAVLFGGNRPSGSLPQTPTAEIRRTVPPRNAEMVREYLRQVGGDAERYGDRLPPHLFPQWGFPIMAETLADIPYDLRRILNGGFRMEIKEPIPAGEELSLAARLDKVEKKDKLIVLTQRLVTGTASQPECLVAYVNAIVPLPKSERKETPEGEKDAKPKPTVPTGAREIDSWYIQRDAGWRYAQVTGDINPVHWVAPYAKAAGFPDVILHGFASAALAFESLSARVFGGEVDRMASFAARFTKPIVMPAEIRVFVSDDNEVFLGDASGEPAYLIGSFSDRR